MQAATRIGIHCIFFLWGLSLSHFQKFQEIIADGVTFLLKHRAIVLRTLVNAITYVFMRMFWNTYTENFIQKNLFSVVLIPGWRIPVHILFWKRSKKKGYSKIPKFLRGLRKYLFFSLTLQTCKAKFPSSTKQTPTKVSCKWRHYSRITIEIL